MTLPSIAIAIIIILVIISFSTGIYFIFKRVKGRGFHVSSGATRQVRGEAGSKLTEANMQQHYGEEVSYISEKKIDITPYAANTVVSKPLMQYHANLVDNTSTIKGSDHSSTFTMPTTPIISSSFEKTPVYERQQQEDTGSSVWTSNSDAESTAPALIQPPPSSPPPALTEFTINLPLPPPCSSFFSDKMELDSMEANDLYTSYMSAAAKQQQHQDFVTIDLDEKPFLASISQKALTLRSTLRQSMRRKSSSGIPKVALNHLFDNGSSNSSVNKIPSSPRLEESARMSRNSSSTSSRYPPNGNQSRSSLQLPPTTSPRPDSPATVSDFFGKLSNNSSKKSLPMATEEQETHSNKIMIDDNLMPPESSYFSLPVPSTTNTTLVMKTTIQEMQQQQERLLQQQEEYASILIQEIDTTTELQQAKVIASSDEEGPDKEKEIEDEQRYQQDAALAARRLIRTASRKSRTRSTIMTTDEATMFTTTNSQSSNEGTPPPTPPILKGAAAAAKYATLRKHNIEIDTNLKRREIQKWTTNDPSSPLTTPSPKRAIMSSVTLNGSNTVSGGKAAKQQLLKNVMTLGRSSSTTTTVATAEQPKSLRNLFTRPSIDESPVTTTLLDKDEDDMGSNKSIVESEDGIEQEEEDDEDKLHSAVTGDISVLTNTPKNVITTPLSKQQQKQLHSPYSSSTTTAANHGTPPPLKKMGTNVDTIRRMLQSSWSGNNLKESGSSTSLSSSDYMGSIGSSFKPVASPLGSINPRLQNQHLVSLSLKAAQARSRPSMPQQFMVEEGGPTPTASFSSSTVRTMIPAEEEEAVETTKKKEGILGGGSVRGEKKQDGSSKKIVAPMMSSNKKQGNGGTTSSGKKTPAQIEREKYLKKSSLNT